MFTISASISRILEPSQQGLISSTILFELIGVLWMVDQTQSQPNHTSYRKLYYNNIVANVLRVNMGMIIFEFRGC